MQEYEYSFKVKTIIPFIDYCKNNDYDELKIENQNRIVYENNNSDDIIARITTKIINGKTNIIFDCKNIGKRDNDLKISKESLPIKITKNNKKQIESLLDVLDFYEAANNCRTRYVYEKNDIKFEIDDYENPKMKVVAIEGKKETVDKIYSELLEKYKKEMEV